MEKLLSIGEFAERCGLSRSALRFYDQNGLLRPQLTDEETGYRYYAVGQLQQALLVRRLRSAEVPIGLLREFLEAPVERRREILAGHSALVRERAAAVAAAIGRLDAELANSERAGSAAWCAVASDALGAGLAQILFAVADPADRVELGGVWVETRDDSLRLVATDSYRLAVRDLVPEQIGPAPIRGIIDAEHARRLSTQLRTDSSSVLAVRADDTVEIAVDGERSRIGGAGDGFPDYERILFALPAGHQIAVAREELERALSGLGPSAGPMALRFTADRLHLRAADRVVSISGTWTGPEQTVFINDRFFREAVEATVGPDVIVEATAELEPVTVRSADNGTFSVLTMPTRPPDRQ